MRIGIRQLEASVALVSCAAGLAARRSSRVDAVRGADPHDATIVAGCDGHGGGLEGDVDGDGRRDRVTLTAAGRDGDRCRFVLGVRGARRAYRTEVRGRFGVDGVDVPYLVALARIAPGPQGQIVVRVHGGASTQTADVYRLYGGVLRRVSIPDIAIAGGGSLRDGLRYAGSLAVSFTVDCVAGRRTGAVLATTFTRDQRGRRVVRRTGLRLSGTRFVSMPRLDDRLVMRRVARGDSTPRGPFASCRQR